jgi:hypothetical protein
MGHTILKTATEKTHQGRFPANLIHDGSQEVLDLFPETKSKARGEADQDGKQHIGEAMETECSSSLRVLRLTQARHRHEFIEDIQTTTEAPQLASSTALKLPRRIATRAVRGLRIRRFC